MSVALPPSSLLYSRYRGLIYSIGIFLLLIAGLMAFSMYSSSQVARNTDQLYAVEQLHTNYQKVGQNLVSLRLNAGEDPKAPQAAYSLKELQAGREGMEQALHALMQGGSIQINDTKFEVDAATDPHVQEAFSRFNRAWKPIYEQSGEYLKTAQSPTTSIDALNDATNIARNNQPLMNDELQTITEHLTATSAAQTSYLRWVQIAGIAAALIYFLVFINYFMKKLRESDEEANEARNETTEILNTVNSGLFLLDSNLQIGNQYSAELENLLGMRNLGNKSLLDILRTKLPDNAVSDVADFVEQLYNTRVKGGLISSLNPLIRIPMQIADLKTGESQSRFMDFNFNRVYKGKDISKVLVSVTDETDAVLLEQKIEAEREQNDIQLDMLATLLNSDQKMVTDFIKNTKRRNLEINNILKQPGESQSNLYAKLNAIFREVHSLKGEASTFNLHGFTVLAENLESELKSLQGKRSLSGEDFLGLTVSLDKLMQLTQTIEGLSRQLVSNKPSTGGSEAADTQPKDRFDAAAQQQAYYARFVNELAERNHKDVNLICGGLENEHDMDEQTGAMVKDICVQMLRNAVVHGIETPAARVDKKKQPTGHIQLEIHNLADSYTVSLRDDGAGIHPDRVKAKAVEQGLCTPEQAESLTQSEIYNLLFSPGFSTAETVTGDAGRGVGLDVIKERVTRLGGDINISSTPDAFTRFSFTFPKK